MAISLRTLKKEIACCEICSEHLPLGPRPVVQFSSKSRIVIVGQAPGTKVHETGIPWDDPSGDHLREWLRVSRKVFYDPSSFALVPSWRSRIWMKKNPWFEAKLLPVLRRRVKKRLQD